MKCNTFLIGDSRKRSLGNAINISLPVLYICGEIRINNYLDIPFVLSYGSLCALPNAYAHAFFSAKK